MIGPKIERRMEELGILTQTDLAKRSGLSVTYINGLIRGSRGKRMSYDAQTRLARALRVKPIFFSGDTADAVNAPQSRTLPEGCEGPFAALE